MPNDSETLQPAAPGRSGWTLRGRLNLLAAVCVLPLLGFTLATDYLDYRAARATAAARTLAVARDLAGDAARLLDSDIAALRTLALSRWLNADGDPAGFAAVARTFLTLQTPGAALAIADAAGRVVATAGDQPAAAFAPDPAALASGQPRVSGYLDARDGGAPGFRIDVPVLRDGRVTWDLMLEPGLPALAAFLAAQRPAPRWTLGVVDADGRLLARLPTGAAAGGPALLGATVHADLLSGMAGAAQGLLPATATLQGVPVLAAFAPVPGYSWHVAVGMPRGELEAPLRRAALLTVLAGGIFLAGGLLLAGWVARGIIGPIARLGAYAGGPMTGKPPPTGLAEADAVARALFAGAAANREALDRLHALAGTLEQRVAAEVAARQEAQARAAQGERLQALGHLSGGIAHDFNNVLQAVNTAADLLERQHAPDQVRRIVRMLHNAARQGAAITGRLLGLARRQPLAPAPLDAATLLADVAELLRATLAASIAVQVAVPADLAKLLADPPQLETVLINLAANARDAMPDGGGLVLSAAAEDVTPGIAAPRGLAPGRYVRLGVADNGSGMDAALLARVTEPFFTTKPAGHGTGLGLALARGFAERSGGALAIESTPGAGTTVHLWLPAA